MKKLLLFAAAACAVFVACKKESSGSKPTLSFANYSSDVYIPTDSAGSFAVTFNIADGDGDITDTLGLLAHFKSNADAPSWLWLIMPDIGANKGHSVKGQVTVKLDPIDIVGNNPNAENDSLWFSAYVRDHDGHFSDTILTPKVWIYKQ